MRVHNCGDETNLAAGDYSLTCGEAMQSGKRKPAHACSRRNSRAVKMEGCSTERGLKHGTVSRCAARGLLPAREVCVQLEIRAPAAAGWQSGERPAARFI